jgi:hypothetical protein
MYCAESRIAREFLSLELSRSLLWLFPSRIPLDIEKRYAVRDGP